MIIYEHGQYSKQFLRDVDPDFPIEWLESLQKLQIQIDKEIDDNIQVMKEDGAKKMEMGNNASITDADRANWKAHAV